MNIVYLFSLLFVPLALTTGCTDDDEPSREQVMNVDQNGYSNFNHNNLEGMLDGLPKEDLSSDELSGLRFMREEEKLARDVYAALHTLWGRQVFDHISAAEQTHMDAVLQILDKYDLEDPASGKEHGYFTNTVVQGLYDAFLVKGQVSLNEALKVGAVIEEVDIRDLQVQLDSVIDNEDLRLVYENLQRGSRNHLRAFVKNLNNQGITYTPQYLAQEVYISIINGPMERG